MTARPLARRFAAQALVCAALAVGIAGCGPTPGTPPPSLPTAPAGAQPLATSLPLSLRHFTLSADRRHIAYMEDVTTSAIGRLQVARLGGEAKLVADVGRDVEQLQWNSRNDALLFGVREDRVIPGEYSDWNLPRTALVAFRLMRVPASGGEPEVLVEAKEQLTFAAAERAEVLVYRRETSPDGRATLMALDLATRSTSKIVEEQLLSGFGIAPDGATVAYGAVDPQSDGVPTLRLLSRVDRKQTTIETQGLGAFGWLDADRLVLMERIGEGARQLRLRVVSKAGVELSSVMVPGEGLAYAPGVGTAGGGTSPDGKWVLAAGKGDGLPIISLETGQVYRSPHLGWVGWLDAETLIGTFHGGLYTMPLAAAFDLTTPASTGGSGK